MTCSQGVDAFCKVAVLNVSLGEQGSAYRDLPGKACLFLQVTLSRVLNSPNMKCTEPNAYRARGRLESRQVITACKR